MLADYQDEVVELNEDNNIVFGDLTVGGDANGPNLVVVQTELDEDTAAPGDRVSFDYGVQNQGQSDVGDVTVGFYLVQRNTGQSPPPIIFLESEIVGNVEAGETESENEEVTIPDGVPPGEYSLAVEADYGNAIEESDETDNVLAAGILTVTGTVASEGVADGAQLALTASPNPTGGTLSLSYRLATPSAVWLAVVDALGREVAVVTGARGAGQHAEALDARAWAPGVYVARLTAGDAAATRAVTVLR